MEGEVVFQGPRLSLPSLDVSEVMMSEVMHPRVGKLRNRHPSGSGSLACRETNENGIPIRGVEFGSDNAWASYLTCGKPLIVYVSPSREVCMAGSDWSLIAASGSGLLLLFAVLKSLVGLTRAAALTSKPGPPTHLIPWHLLNCFSGRLFWNARARELNIKIH